MVGKRNYQSEALGRTYMKLALLVNVAKEDEAMGSNFVHKTQDSKGNRFTKVHLNVQCRTPTKLTRQLSGEVVLLSWHYYQHS